MTDGRVILCCVDWEEAVVFGDLNVSTLYDIWHNETYRRYRRQFLSGTLEGLLCASCKKEFA